MKLRPFEQEVLSASGNAQDLLKQFYDKSIGQNNAEKQLAGIRTHLNYLEEISEEHNERQIGEMEETIVKADGSITTKRLLLLSEEDSKNPTRIMELMGFDVLQWAIVSCKIRRNYWDVTMKLAQGSDEHGHKNQELPHKETNHAFECTLSVKPIQNVLSTDMITELFSKLTPPELIKYERSNKGGMMLELPIMDLHLGKLSWKEEIGHNYSLKIAERLFKQTITDILNQIHDYGIKIEKCLYFIGQDFFHMDTAKNTTTAGTPMDSDTRWPKMFDKGVELTVWVIEQLRSIAPVECIYVSSNHDKVLSYALAQTISAWYRKCDDITIDYSPSPRKYIKYGKCLIGASHGADEGKTRIQTIMQAENPKDWGNTVFREWHLAHIHSEQVKEIAGVIIRNMSSITALDNWHKEHGYSAMRKAQALLWDKNLGKRLTIDSNIKV